MSTKETSKHNEIFDTQQILYFTTITNSAHMVGEGFQLGLNAKKTFKILACRESWQVYLNTQPPL